PSLSSACLAPSTWCCCSAAPAALPGPSARSPGASSVGCAVLEVRDLVKVFDGFVAVGGVSLEAPTGSIGAIIGPNGAGKTTLFNLITGHLRPDRGQVKLNGRDVTGIAPHDLCRLGMGRSFQRTNIFPPLTGLEYVPR